VLTVACWPVQSKHLLMAVAPVVFQLILNALDSDQARLIRCG